MRRPPTRRERECRRMAPMGSWARPTSRAPAEGTRMFERIGRSAARRMALRRPRVVIIDDDARVASILGDLVLAMRTQYSVETASNGAAGLEAVRRERPDLVLLDLRMPGIDGVEVVKGIRDMDAGIAVVVITGAGDLVDASAALAS